MSRPLRLLVILSAVPLGLVVYFLIKNSRVGTQSPAYQIVRSSGSFEVRDYPALTIASTPMQNEDDDGSFGKLFRYIAGANAKSQKISMTTPVLIDSLSAERTMSFILPEPVVATGVPQPTGNQIIVHRMEPARYAAYRFSGGDDSASKAAAVTRLEEWVRQEKLPTRGQAIFAFYDPPWTPGFLRRNEVLLPLEPASRL